MASIGGFANGHSRQPLFSFGVISDVQYADIPDGHSFLGIPRYYRHSIMVLQRAVRDWNDRKKLHFSINLGDIVDGYCPRTESLAAVQRVVEEFERFDGPTYHIVGNHCLYNLPRSQLMSLLKMPSSHGHAYYEFAPCPEYKIVVLDSYDISVIGWPKDHPNALAAVQVLEAKNPNADKNSPSGMVGTERRFLKFNGGVGREQLVWLDDALRDAEKKGQKVILCSHVPLYPKATTLEAIVWNYEEVLELIHRYECVKACFSGHEHLGGYAVDPHAVHHRVIEAALECPPGSSAYGHVDVYHDRICLVGTDRLKSTEMVFCS